MALVQAFTAAKLARWLVTPLFGLYVGVLVVRMATAEVPDKYLTPLLDYDSFMHAAESLANGLNPYAYNSGIEPPPSAPYGINLNPPVSLIPFTLLNELVEPAAGRLAMQVASVGGLLGMLALLVRRYPENGGALTVLALVWVSHIGGTVWWGQIYVLLALCSVTGFLAFDQRRWWLAGLAFGVLVAMKPPFLVVPVLLLVAGHRREGVAILGVAAGLSVVPVLLWGTDIYRQWYEVSSSLGAIHYEGWPRGSMSLASASFVLLGSKAPGLVLSGVVVSAFAVWIFTARARFSATDVAGYALVIAMIVSPVTWPSYTPIIMPALMACRLNRGAWAGIVMLWFACGIGILLLLAARIWEDTPRAIREPAGSRASATRRLLSLVVRNHADGVEQGASQTGAPV